MTNTNKVPERQDFYSAWRCRYGHTNRLNLGQGFPMGSSWDWCGHCSEGPSTVDYMRMQIHILNQWLQAGLIDLHYFHAMANWAVTHEEKEQSFYERTGGPPSEVATSAPQRAATRLLRSLNRAVLALEDLEDLETAVLALEDLDEMAKTGEAPAQGPAERPGTAHPESPAGSPATPVPLQGDGGSRQPGYQRGPVHRPHDENGNVREFHPVLSRIPAGK